VGLMMKKKIAKKISDVLTKDAVKSAAEPKEKFWIGKSEVPNELKEIKSEKSK
jgi:hypothetical protein